MLDVVLKWSADGQQQVIQSAKAITAEVNKGFGASQQQRQAQWSRQQQQLAREMRRETFSRLSAEEKLARLTERRINLERLLHRAETQGNTYRAQAMRLRLAQVDAAIPALQRPGFFTSLRSGFGQAVSGSVFGAAAGGFGGAAVGGAIGGAIGVAAIGLVSSFKRITIGALELADNLGDIAEQMQISRGDVLRLQEAATRAGVPQRAALRGVAQIGQMRAAALGGDEQAMKLLKNYGVTQEMLQGRSSNLDIAMAVRRSLGAAGMRPGDERNLARLFGEMPGRTMSLLGELQNTEDTAAIEQDLAALDRANSRWERTKQTLSRWWTSTLGGAVEFAEDVKLAFGGGMGLELAKAMTPKPAGAGLGLGERTAGAFNVSSAESKQATLGALGGRTAADALTRIGLFVGGNNAVMRRMDQQISELRRITRELQQMHRTIQEDA